MTTEIKKLLAILNENGGFTVDTDGNLASDGYMVAKENFETVLPESLVTIELLTSLFNSYKAKLTSKADCIGAWLNEGKIYFDVSEKFNSLETALQIGRERNQLAIFNLGTFEEITC